MKFNRYLICALFLVLICCIGAASAADAGDDVVAADDTIDEAVSEAIDVSDEIDEEPLGVSEEPALSDGETGSDEGYVIYVGNNTQDGNGTYENPFKNFQLACDNVTSQEKVTLKIFAGEYDLGGSYYFDTNDLNIIGIDGKVTINSKFAINDDELMDQYFADGQILMGECFGLTSKVGTFSMENIIFDSSIRDTKNQNFASYMDDDDYMIYYFFEPFHFRGSTFQESSIPNWNLDISGVFKNCSFVTNTNVMLRAFEFNSTFINCRFEANEQLFRASLVNNTSHIFNYCSFNYELGRLASYYYWPFELRMDNCWFGQNKLPEYITNFASLTYNTTGLGPGWDPIANPIQKVSNYTVPISRYAIFNVT